MLHVATPIIHSGTPYHLPVVSVTWLVDLVLSGVVRNAAFSQCCRYEKHEIEKQSCFSKVQFSYSVLNTTFSLSSTPQVFRPCVLYSSHCPQRCPGRFNMNGQGKWRFFRDPFRWNLFSEHESGITAFLVRFVFLETEFPDCLFDYKESGKIWIQMICKDCQRIIFKIVKNIKIFKGLQRQFPYEKAMVRKSSLFCCVGLHQVTR